jgi:hypothetical protein
LGFTRLMTGLFTKGRTVTISKRIISKVLMETYFFRLQIHLQTYGFRHFGCPVKSGSRPVKSVFPDRSGISGGQIQRTFPLCSSKLKFHIFRDQQTDA